MLLNILNLFAVVQFCTAANTYINYDLTDAFSKLNQAVKNGESRKSLINQGQAITELFEHLKNSKSSENYLLTQKSSYFSVSSECFRQITNLVGSLENEELWSFQILDAFGKPPSGILYSGSYKWIGEYNECLNVTVPSIKWVSKYCSAKPSDSLLFYGVCFPMNCSTNDIATILNTIIKYANISSFQELNSNNIVCQEGKILDMPGIIAITILSSILAVILIATTFDIYKLHRRKVNFANESTNILILPINEDTISINDTQNLIVQDTLFNVANSSEPCFSKFLTSLSFINSAKKILNTNIILHGELNCLHSIRFLSISWVILGHTYLLIIYFANNTVLAAEMFRRFSFSIITNGTFSVDSFFLLSGLLTSFTFLKELTKRNSALNFSFMVKYYVHRLWRLSPPYYAMIVFSLLLTKYLGSGPMFPPDGFENPDCKWGWNLLYINNFLGFDKQCFGISWYLANDIQMHFLAPIILIPLAFGKTIFAFITSLLLVITAIISVALTLFYNPNSELAGNDPIFINWVYVKPWTRMSPYVIGIFLGYVLYRRLNKPKVKINWILNGMSWIFACMLCAFCVFGLYLDYRKFPEVYLSKTSHILYQSFCRTFWAFGLGYIIYACETGNGGLLAKLLTWKIWVPLSKLSYSAYLVHFTVILYFYTTQTYPIDLQEINTIYFYLGNLFFSYVAAFFLSTFFELPLCSIEKFILKIK